MSQSTILGFPVLVGRDPTLNVIGSSSATVTTSRQAATDLLGQYTSFAALQAVTTAGLNRTGLISEAVVGGVSYRYAFVAGTATANSPLVLLPNDYNASTNAFSYQLLGIVHGSLFLPATSVAPATPATGVVLYSNSAGNLVTLGASVPANSVLTPAGFTTTLPTAVQVAPGSLNSGTGAAATTFWRGDGVWAAPTTEGYVVGPGTSVNNALATWNGTSGTALNSIGIAGSANALTALNSITSVATNNLVLATGTFGTALTFASATGAATLAATTTSTSTTTGSLVNAGGFGNGGKIYSGDEIYSAKSIYSTLNGSNTFASESSFQAAVTTGTAANVFTAWDGARGLSIQASVVGGNAGTLSFGYQNNAPSFYSVLSIQATNGVASGLSYVSISPNNTGSASWGTSGAIFRVGAPTVQDTGTAASGTAASAVFTSFSAPTLTATNTSVTTTDAATVYIAGGPVAGTYQTITNTWGLWNAGKTRLDSDVWLASGAIRLTVSSHSLTVTGYYPDGSIIFAPNTVAALTLSPTAGVATFGSTTASTSTTTGAAVVSGGLGVAGAGYFGGTVTLSGNNLTYGGGSSLTDNGSGQLTLAAGTSGASVVIGQGSSGQVKITTSNSSFPANTANLVISTGSTDCAAGIQYTPKSTHFNWFAGAQSYANNTFEITPSTVPAGTTFSSPAITIVGSTSAVTANVSLTTPSITMGSGTGTVSATSGVFSVTSDERTKNIHSSFTRGLADIRKIQPVLFDHKWDTKHVIQPGYTAQNVQQAIPETVFNDGADGMLTVSDRGIQMALVNATKELDTTNQESQKRIQQLEAQVTVLQQQLATLKAT